MCRDIEERGRDLEQVLKQYIHLVKPAFEEFTLPVCYYLPCMYKCSIIYLIAIIIIDKEVCGCDHSSRSRECR